MARPRPTTDGILEAAERVFARQGYGESSLRDLMAEAAVSTTAFYSRFPSKEAVLEALVGRLLGAIADAASQAFAKAKNVEDGAGRGVDVLVAGLAGHKVLLKLVLTEAAVSRTSRPTVARAYHAFVELLTGVLKPQPTIRDPQALAWALVGSAHIHVMRWAVLEELDEPELKTALRASARAVLSPYAVEAAPRRRR